MNHVYVAWRAEDFGLDPLPESIVDSHGMPMDTSGSVWRFNDPSHISSFDFDRYNITNPWLLYSLKRHLIFSVRRVSPRESYNIITLNTLYMAKAKTWPQLISASNIEHHAILLNKVMAETKELLASQSVLFNFSRLRAWFVWCSDYLPELGFDPEEAYKWQLVKVPKNESGVAVRTSDPTGGPLDDAELILLRRALMSDRSMDPEHIQQRGAIWLALVFGRNPSNFVLLRQSDFCKLDEDLEDEWILRIPRIKKRSLPRTMFKNEYVDSSLARVIESLIADGPRSPAKEPTERPLLARQAPREHMIGTPMEPWAWHLNASEFTQLIQSAVERYGLISPRTGEPLYVTTRRLRYTFATNRVREGISARDLADALDHSDLQHEPFSNESRFADLVKAIIRLRAEIGGQGATNQQELIIAFRYVYDELVAMGTTDLKQLKRENLDAAAKKVQTRETEVSTYKRVQRLEEIARLLDENGLVIAKLDWRCSWNARPGSMRHGLLEEEESDASTKKSKLPTDGIIEAVAYLYHHIPKSEWADRVRICLVSLLVITGFRIGELLALPAIRVQTEDGTGRRFLIYYPEKGAPPQEKWLLTAGGELAEAMVDELLELTAAPRAMAKWLHDHPASLCIDGLDLTKPHIQVSKIAEALELAGGTAGAAQFLAARKIAITGEGEEATVPRDAFVKALRAESYDKPINTVENTGEKIFLKDALACAFCNAFHATRVTLKYAVRPISEQQLSDFIRARAGQPAAFARYGVDGPDGTPLNVSSHAFRHWLNDLLDRGGLSDVEQAVYFGRLNPKDNRAYQHMTPGERVRKAREDLKGGSLLGPVANLIRRLPIDRQDAVLAARVQAVHVVPGGACFHQFSQTPCPNQMACTDGCGDFHWQTDDAVEERELTFQKSVLQIAVDTARREVAEESWGADSWLQHNLRKLDQVNSSLCDCGAARERSRNG